MCRPVWKDNIQRIASQAVLWSAVALLGVLKFGLT